MLPPLASTSARAPRNLPPARVSLAEPLLDADAVGRLLAVLARASTWLARPPRRSTRNTRPETDRTRSNCTASAALGTCPYAQVFAPPDDDAVCFGPMTAPTDALRGCLGPPPAVSPGECYRARFTIAVECES